MIEGGKLYNHKAIGGNNFFKLRDLCKAFNIGVTWDGATKTLGIDTALPYTE